MGEHLAVDHRVVSVDMMSLEAEDLFQPAYQGLADLGHRGVPLPPRLHRGVPQRCLADAGLVQNVEELEIRADVERQSVVGDPAGDGHAHGRDSRLSRENAGYARAKCSGEVEFLEDQHDGGVQAIEVVRERQAECVQWQSEIR